MTGLPVSLASKLQVVEPERRWLIDELWGRDEVGIVGGEPKSFKSFLALQMAVAVCSGRPCLGRFTVPRRGRALLFAAEDALHIVRERLGWICAQMGAELSGLDLWVITAPTVRIDLERDSRLLAETVADLQPDLLVLDPFVRLHRVDENVAAVVAPLLASLRELQRRHGCAVVVVHHARKGGARRPGQALRGSSEFHAWGDTNLYLRRIGDDRLQMDIEHRAWPGMSGISLVLRSEPGRVALVAGEPTQAPQDEPEEAPPPRHRVLAALAETDRPMRTRELRAACRMRTATVGSVLQELLDANEIVRGDDGWHLPAAAPTSLANGSQRALFPG